MSSANALPPPPGSGLTPTVTRPTRAARRKRWPSWVIVAVSLAGVVAAIVAYNTILTPMRVGIAGVAFGVVLVTGTVMLFLQRVLDVSVARQSGTPLISSFGTADTIAFILLLLASVANGIVLALQVARQ